MSPLLPSRPGVRRLLVVGLLLAMAALLAAPAAGAAPRGASKDATADRLTGALGAQGAAPTSTPRGG